MISVEEAQNIIKSQQPNWGEHEVSLTKSIGKMLAENIYADRDFPPFDRVTMDGIALNFDAFDAGRREFRVQEVQLAGVEPVSLVSNECAIEIMTGAILSHGCDLVIRYEDLEFFEQSGERWVRVNLSSTERWKNIHKQASDQPQGELLIEKGVCITAAEIAIMATVGSAEVAVKKEPSVAIISTGDELVDISDRPLPHQIRKSNVTAMEASLHQLNVPCEVFHLLDNKQMLKEHLGKILETFDVLLLSGGVSKGKADYLPEVLEELQVKKMFHRVAQRPGKPFWFGIGNTGKPVFAFPGNPISTYMCFRIYFIPWLMENLGRPLETKTASIKEDFSFKPSLGYFLQVKSEVEANGTIWAHPEAGHGSGDLANLASSDAFLYLPGDQAEFKTGSSYHYYSFDISNLA